MHEPADASIVNSAAHCTGRIKEAFKNIPVDLQAQCKEFFDLFLSSEEQLGKFAAQCWTSFYQPYFQCSAEFQYPSQMIGVHPDVMAYLHEKGLLKSLEPREAKKVSHYHTAEILEKTQDRQWMAKVMEAAREYHALRNARKKVKRHPAQAEPATI